VAEGCVRESKDGALLNVRVSPRVRNTSLEWGIRRLGAQGSGGRSAYRRGANAELEGFLAGIFGVAASSVEVVRGAPGRDKIVLLRGTQAQEIRQEL